MSDFYANSSFLERKHFFTKYYLLIKDISFGASDVESIMNKLKNYNGFGIEEQIANLKKCSTQLRDYKEDVRTEFYSLVKIVDTINDYENRANGILGENNSKSNDFVLAQPEPLTKTLSHSDIGKLLNQLKYYTQENDGYKKLYDYLTKKYDTNQTVRLTDSEYATIKNMFLLMVNNVNYNYSSIEYFKSDESSNTEPKGDAGFSYKGGSDGKTKGKLSVDALNTNDSIGLTSLTITSARKVGNDYFTDIITLSNVKLERDVNLASVDIVELVKQITSKKKSFDEIFTPLGISISGSGTCCTGTSTIIKNIKGDLNYYNEMVYKIGEVNAEAGINASEAKFKIGASIASVEAKHGIITNSGKYDVGGKASAGVEFGAKIGGKSELSAGMFSLSLDIDDGFDFYVWE